MPNNLPPCPVCGCDPRESILRGDFTSWVYAYGCDKAWEHYGGAGYFNAKSYFCWLARLKWRYKCWQYKRNAR